MLLVESEKPLLVALLKSEKGNIAGNAFADHDNQRRQSKPLAGRLATSLVKHNPRSAVVPAC